MNTILLSLSSSRLNKVMPSWFSCSLLDPYLGLAAVFKRFLVFEFDSLSLVSLVLSNLRKLTTLHIEMTY